MGALSKGSCGLPHPRALGVLPQPRTLCVASSKDSGVASSEDSRVL